MVKDLRVRLVCMCVKAVNVLAVALGAVQVMIGDMICKGMEG